MPPNTDSRKRATRTATAPQPAPEPRAFSESGTTHVADVEGALTAITADGLVGWAWSPIEPNRPVTVVIIANGLEVGRGVADRFDAAVSAAHGQSGRPGFCLRLAALPGGIYPLLLTLHDLAGRRLGPPFRVADIAQLLPITDAVPALYEGSVDQIREGIIAGWARDVHRPDIPLTIELLDGGQVIARVRADEFRDDLRAAGKGNGHHGYQLPMPIRLLDGQGHTLRVRIAGSKFELPRSPIAFGPLAPHDPAIAMQDLQSEVRRLSERVDALSDPSSRLLSDIVRQLSERMAALAEIQREAIERELDALRRLAFARPEAPPPVAMPVPTGTKAARRR